MTEPLFTVKDIFDAEKRWEDVSDWLSLQADVFTGHNVHYFDALDAGTRGEPLATFKIYAQRGTVEEVQFKLADLINASPEKTAARLAEEARQQEILDESAAERAAIHVEEAERRRLRELLTKYPDEASTVVIPAV